MVAVEVANCEAVVRQEPETAKQPEAILIPWAEVVVPPVIIRLLMVPVPKAKAVP